MNYGNYKVYRAAGSADVEVQHDVTGCRGRWPTGSPTPTMERIQEMVDEHEDSCLFF